MLASASREPIWGTAAAIAMFVAYYVTGAGVLGAIAHFAAWLNLFNLFPVWQLDGGRGMRALTRSQRIILICVIVATWVATREGFLIVLAALAAYRLTTKTGRPRAIPRRFGSSACSS